MLLYVSVLAVNGETFRRCCSVLHNQRVFSSSKRHRTRDSIIISEIMIIAI